MISGWRRYLIPALLVGCLLLVGFWESIVQGVPVRNAAEHARADIALVQKFAALALG